MVRSVTDISGIADRGKKFQSRGGDEDFTIVHGITTLIVDIYGRVLFPVNSILEYEITDSMTGNQTGQAGTVKDFLTVDPSMDSPGSKVW
jgi:hypothetical protein